MYVIALTGKVNTGKTETLNIVYQLLLFDGYKQVKNLPSPFIFRVLGNDQKDFTDVLEKKGKVVGIVTMGDFYSKEGDDGETIKNLLRRLFNAGCTTAICACTGENVEKIRLELQDYPNITFQKSIASQPSEERIKNNSDAQTIFNHI
jgi:hypothetical protein